MFWIIVARYFCKMDILRDFPSTLKAGIFIKKKKKISPFIRKRIWFFSLHSIGRRQGKIYLEEFRNNRICCFFTICKSRSVFGRILCTVFETVCASSLAMCAYQISEHLHLTFADHLDLYSQQAHPNFRFPSEQIPLFLEWIMSLVWNILNRK
jgi:hypothetical protein